MKIIMGFLLILTLFFANIYSQEFKYFWDGFDWQKVDSVTINHPEYAFWIKSAYISGLMDGKNFYGFLVKDKDRKIFEDIYQDFLQPGKYKDYIKALDQFYRQESNLYLPIPSALIAVRMRALGLPEEEVNNYIISSKLWINKLMKDSMAK